MKFMNAEIYRRKTAFAELKGYDGFAKNDDFIEVTEWFNMEGFDVNLSTQHGNQRMSFTWGEYEALKDIIRNHFS